MKKIKLSDYGFNILQIETSANCNMACSFCPYPLKDDFSSKLDLNEIKNIIHQINNSDKNFKYITFSQFNEPLLDSRIFDILKIAKEQNLKRLFITNGLLLNKEKNIQGLIENKPDIKISLQVLDKEKHKDARGLNMDLDNYVRTVINFCERIKKSDLNIVIDLGCNFNDNYFKLYIKNILGLQIGDPAMPNNLKKTLNFFFEYLVLFHDIADKEYKDNLKNILDQIKQNKFSKQYIDQTGYKISNNITLKIKPFHYGRKIQDFYPINDNFSCDSEILGILADGNVVPCCLAYDETISLGNIKKKNLESILENNIFIKNLRLKNGKKHDTCKKCFGEPTKRGAISRNIINYFRS